MYGVNKVQLVGNLGADPELRATLSGKPVCNLRIAVTEPPFGDGKEDVTSWHDVVVWGKPGEAAAELRKGDMVIVFGRLSTRSFDKDGEKRYRTEVVADSIGPVMFGRSGDARSGGERREPDDRSGERDNRGGGYRQDSRAPAQSGGQRREEPARREDRRRGFQ